MTVEIEVEEPGAVLRVCVTGKLTREDHEEFVPVVDQLIAERAQARVLLEMHNFHGWTVGALWSDLAFGIKQLEDIDRLAVVGERLWQKGLALFCRPFSWASIRYFRSEDVEEAREWLHEGLRRFAAFDPFDFSNAPEGVAKLLRILAGDDGLERRRARLELVEMGTTVTDVLIRAARCGGMQLRLEATQALAAIADPKSADALASQFEDSFQIGWAAAEGLKRLGRSGAEAALHQLIRHPTSRGVRVSAHHALRHMHDIEVRKAVAPVVAALAHAAPVEEAPVAALAALETLRR